MSRLIRRSRCWVVIALASGVLSGCGSPPDESPQQKVVERLVGTWLREYHDQGTQVRRVLVLQSDGSFDEHSVVTDSRQVFAKNAHHGLWRFDGTNLKRRYTSVNGQPPAAPMVPFATIELHFDSPDEFTGIDRVRGRKMVYHRVVEGTQP